MSVSIASRFHRTVRKLSRCTPYDESLSRWVAQDLLRPNEAVLGIYEMGNNFAQIVFCDEGVIFYDRDLGRLDRIDYSSMNHVVYPLPASDSISLLISVVGPTDVRRLDVSGVDGAHRDVFEVGRFIMRVLEDRVNFQC